ncbi:XRCC4-like factor-domain-containing protein [Podospora didyma]|uniref:Non-homologous end-joining factor 1 n=1 Tax=Podospora didyma TaxID=330526 RepID=A0AAE0U6H3_9PEZI|nr:XRCC4-like factor-domain-containing protein [Podospora didyma]
MQDHPSWRLLPVAVPGIPNLLVSTAFTAESYVVHLSDLANVWVEAMDRKPIVKRGLVEDTSIDPTDGPDQIRRMLELLRAAFDVDDPEHANTTLSLTKDSDDDSLALHVTCILPKPLKPFRWPMCFKKCLPSTLTTELVLPFVQAHEARAQEISSLIAALREKDSVITRLVDKLEATGMGLEHVFSSLSGKRKVSRATAEAKIKGLAPFVEADFRNTSAEKQYTAGPADMPALLSSVFGVTGGLKYKTDLDLEASTSLNNWWTKLSQGKQLMLVDRPKEEITKDPLPPKSTEPKGDGDDDDDDFQVQATPPRLSAARKRDIDTRPQTIDDDETSDGEDAPDALESVPLPLKTVVTGKPSNSRIGAIGRHKKPSSSPPRQVAPPPAKPTKRHSYGDDSDTASDTASEILSVGSKASPPPSSHKALQRRGGLGRIGGKAKEMTLEAEPHRCPSPAGSKGQLSPIPTRHRLGVIGKKAPSQTIDTRAESTSDDERGRSKTPAATQSKERPRETSQERADRKRAELQRDLEWKAAAGPAKKKRKF